LTPLRDIVDDTRSDLTCRRISQWLARCVEHHDTCNAKANFTPTRVIAVGSSGDNQVRLMNAVPKQPYAALSYCWGSDLDGVVITNTWNFQRHCISIVLNSLAATIQDAIFVCRGLGIHFLWVDALCIIQDDGNDWLRESARMRLVYSNAYLTIVAHNAAPSKEGFLGKQFFGQPSWQRRFCSNRARLQRKYHLRVGIVPFSLEMWQEFSKVEERGWTLQECILSPRLVHFTGLELVWECEQGPSLCECGHMMACGAAGQPTKTQFSQYGIDNITNQSWMRLVGDFTSRNLSRQSDRLIALSGLAEMVYARTNKTRTYLAGLWSSNLQEQLLWHSYNTQRSRPSPPTAPSWSWASLGTPIIWEGPWMELGLSQVEVHYGECFCNLLVQSNAFGAVTSGELAIEGFVQAVCVVTVEAPNSASSDAQESGLTFLGAPNGVRIFVFSDLSHAIDIQSADPRAQCWRGHCSSDGDGWCGKCRLSPEKWQEGRYYCLQVVANPIVGITVGTNFSGGPPIEELQFYFLLLERFSGSEDIFERVGMAGSECIDPRSWGPSQRSKSRKDKSGEDILPFFPDAEWKKIRIV